MRILDLPDDAVVEGRLAAEISDALEPPAGWPAAKKKGRAEVPSGEATVALDQLLVELESRAVFVVPSGAVESWVKSASGRSTAWVVDVIEKDLIESAGEAQSFVASVLESLSAK